MEGAAGRARHGEHDGEVRAPRRSARAPGCSPQGSKGPSGAASLSTRSKSATDRPPDRRAFEGPVRRHQPAVEVPSGEARHLIQDAGRGWTRPRGKMLGAEPSGGEPGEPAEGGGKGPGASAGVRQGEPWECCHSSTLAGTASNARTNQCGVPGLAMLRNGRIGLGFEHRTVGAIRRPRLRPPQSKGMVAPSFRASRPIPRGSPGAQSGPFPFPGVVERGRIVVKNLAKPAHEPTGGRGGLGNLVADGLERDRV